MRDNDEFNNLLKRAKAGDERAIQDFLSKFEQEVQTMVRARLPRKLRSRFDSTDFVQSVWQSLFATPGRDSPVFATVEHFRGFLFGMVRNKVHEQHRRLTRTGKYDLAREEPLYVRRGDREVVREVVSAEPTPSQNFQADDRMAQLMEGRSPREIEVINLRRQGQTYVEIAARTGIHERTVRRIIEDLRSLMESN